MYSRDDLFIRQLECYFCQFGVCFPRCFTTRETDTKIKVEKAYQQFATPGHIVFALYVEGLAQGC